MLHLEKSTDLQNLKSDTREKEKPKHVKRLDFGASVLDLKATRSGTSFENKGIAVDEKISKIPCTRRKDFVRQWIERHNDDKVSNLSDSHSGGKRCEISPLIGSRRKRPRKRKNGSDKGNTVSPFPVTCNDCNPIEKNVIATGSGSAVSAVESVWSVSSQTCTNVQSPILDSRAYSHRRRRKRRRARDSKHSQTCADDVNTDNENVKNQCKYISEENHEKCIDEDFNHSVAYENHRRKQIKFGSTSHLSVLSSSLESEICNIADISEPSECNSKIQIDNTDDDDGDCNGSDEQLMKCHKLKITSDSSDTENIINDSIHDSDTRDSFASVRQQEPREIPVVATKNFDETFCSTLEKTHSVNSQVSVKISQLSSDNREDKTNSFTISIYASPPRSNSYPVTAAEILDSAKKRRKPKKGSTAERLQVLINGKISNKRIWCHQMKQSTFEDSSIQAVIVRLKKLVLQFGRQFLEGVIIEDHFDLLKNYIGTGIFTEISNDTQSSSKQYKGIMIMTIPEIVGKIQMTSESVLKIYPPWEILDEQKSILNVTYFTVVSTDKYSNLIQVAETVQEVKQLVTEEYNCQCFNAEKKLEFCKEHSKKPDVIEQIMQT